MTCPPAALTVAPRARRWPARRADCRAAVGPPAALTLPRQNQVIFKSKYLYISKTFFFTTKRKDDTL
jgi:hypothetical protein